MGSPGREQAAGWEGGGVTLRDIFLLCWGWGSVGL